MPPETRREDPATPRLLSRFLVVGFFFLGLIIILHHEMWQDEWQAWMIARDSASLPALFHNLRYEGHPGLWYVLLYLITRFTHQALAGQLFHLLIATAAVYIFLKYSPFTTLQKALFIFGYFPFYEYAAISRNYAAGILLVFAWCACYQANPRKNYLWLSLILFLLSQMSVYGLFLAMALGTMLILQVLGDNRERINWRQIKYDLAISIVIFLSGIILFIYQLVQPADSGNVVGWNFNFDLNNLIFTISTIWKGFVPIPAMNYHFWNSNIISSQVMQFCLALFIIGYSCVLFLRTPAVFFLFVFGTLEILVFTYTKYPGSLRHHGHLFILFMVCWWLSSASPEGKIKWKLMERIADFTGAHKNKFLYAILSAQLIAGLAASGMDLLQPFSGSKAAAKYLRDHKLDDLVMVGDEDDAASAVSGYLNRRIFYPSSDRLGSFVIWDQKRKRLDNNQVLKVAQELAADNTKEVLLILNRDLGLSDPGVTLLKKFSESIIPAENYYLYLVRNKSKTNP